MRGGGGERGSKNGNERTLTFAKDSNQIKSVVHIARGLSFFPVFFKF